MSASLQHHEAFRRTITLPPDVVGAVCHFLDGDISSSKACAATCRTWYSPARPYIYHTIKLIRFSQVPQLETYLSTHPRMCYWIRDLHIGRRSKFPTPDYWFQTISASNLSEKLTRVSSLTIRGLNYAFWDDEETTQFFRLLSHFSAVTSFGLVGCAFTLPMVKASLITFKDLKELYVDNLLHCPIPVQPKLTIPAEYLLQPSLFHYAIKPPYTNYGPTLSSRIIEMFTPGKTIPTTLELRICQYTSHDNSPLSEAPQAPGPHLHHLILKCDIPDTWYLEKYLHQPEKLKHLDLTHSTELRTFEMHPFNHPATLDLLSGLSSPHLENIIFSLSFNWVKCLNGKRFKAIDSCLEGEFFRSLRQVQFDYSGPLEEQVVDLKIRRTFPKLEARGIISVKKVRDVEVGAEDG